MRMIPLHAFDDRVAPPATYVCADDVQSVHVHAAKSTADPFFGVIVTLRSMPPSKTAVPAHFIGAPSLNRANKIAADIAALINESATLITDDGGAP